MFDDRGSSSAGTAVGVFLGMAGMYWLAVLCTYVLFASIVGALVGIILVVVYISFVIFAVGKVLMSISKAGTAGFRIIGVALGFGAVAGVIASFASGFGVAEWIDVTLASFGSYNEESLPEVPAWRTYIVAPILGLLTVGAYFGGIPYVLVTLSFTLDEILEDEDDSIAKTPEGSFDPDYILIGGSLVGFHLAIVTFIMVMFIESERAHMLRLGEDVPSLLEAFFQPWIM